MRRACRTRRLGTTCERENQRQQLKRRTRNGRECSDQEQAWVELGGQGDWGLHTTEGVHGSAYLHEQQNIREQESIHEESKFLESMQVIKAAWMRNIQGRLLPELLRIGMAIENMILTDRPARGLL